ncbi:MAG: late competence development ComFB family protein [Cyanobacteriota bacterium]|jgi:hypothetical protein
MSIQSIVAQALQDGYLTPAMESEVGRICESATELSIEEYMALDRLMSCLLSGEVAAMPHKQFINVMEDLVVTEVMTRVAEIGKAQTEELDVSDITAYALNRLPPLYATTEEGANYQRDKAQQALRELIVTQVEAGIAQYLNRPEIPDRKPLDKPVRKDTLSQLSELLQSYGTTFGS